MTFIVIKQKNEIFRNCIWLKILKTSKTKKKRERSANSDVSFKLLYSDQIQFEGTFDEELVCFVVTELL